MLSDRLNGAATTKSEIALAVGLVGAIAVAVIAVAGYLNTSASLAEKSELVLHQESEIRAQEATVAEQREEIQAKAMQLTEIREQMALLSAELDQIEQSLQQESDRRAVLEVEIIALKDKEALLQAENSALQSKIILDEQRIQELNAQQSATDRIIVSHYGVGVDQNNHGTVFPIKVEIIESGTGILSVDINNVQYEPGFQSAVRAAAVAASHYSGESISDKDIIVRFAYEDSMFGGEPVKVDGSSAGAVIAAMIAAGLSDKQINSSVLLTGSISEDGIVGRIGSLEEKVVAADAFGAEAMLVPESQEFESDVLTIIGVSDIDDVMDRLTT